MTNTSTATTAHSFGGVLVMAFILPVILATLFAPYLGLQKAEFDFVLLCLLASVIVNVPLLLLELALAKRAKTSPLLGMMQLTREADATTHWRWSSWLGVVLLPLLAGAVLSSASTQVLQQQNISLSSSIVVLIGSVVVVALSLLPRMILLAIATVAGLTSLALGLTQFDLSAWQWTAFQWSEWTKAMVLLLVSTGFGLGMYWQNSVKVVQQRENLLPFALPLWLAQLAGIVLFSFLAKMTAWGSVSVAVAGVALAGLFLNLCREQLLARQVALPIQACILLVPLLLWAIPMLSVALVVLAVLILANVLINSVFVGWAMKISHLRKSLQLSNELLYNLWRVMVRIVLPLAIVMAVLGWLVG